MRSHLLGPSASRLVARIRAAPFTHANRSPFGLPDCVTAWQSVPFSLDGDVGYVKQKLIAVTTTRYSVFFRRLLQEFSDGTTAVVDKRRFAAMQFPELIEDWCSNTRIRSTRDFRLLHGRTELAGSHDSPKCIWADLSILPLIEKLASEKIIRYEVHPTRRPAARPRSS